MVQLPQLEWSNRNRVIYRLMFRRFAGGHIWQGRARDSTWRNYLPRVADGLLTRALQSSGAVQIKGPKWCGKTATAERQSASQVFMQDPDRSATLLALADTKPSLILRGEEPRLIDEWQMAPQLGDAVRFAIDRGRGRGRFILTGSATPQQEPAHSGVGRIARLTMRTMSLFESQESTGVVSLGELFDGKP